MLGLMQDWPLLVHKVLDHAAIYAGDKEIVSRGVEGPMRRTNWRTIHERSRRLAKALTRRGVKTGDRLATLAWNSERHLESWYGITGAGGVYHTLNPRLFPEQLVYIANHAEDRAIFVDLTFVPILEKLQDQLKTVESYVVLTDAAHMPQTSLRNAVAYEELLKEADADFEWVSLEENAACGLCYTSGTTGNPKGVLYSHRSNVLHAMAILSADGFALSNADTVLPIVPMFHANAWSLSFSAPMTGAKMVMPGAKLDGPSVYELLETEQVTMSAAVPTVWLMLLQHMEANDLKLSSLKRVAIGGSACPPSMIQKFEQNLARQLCKGLPLKKNETLKAKEYEQMTRSDDGYFKDFFNVLEDKPNKGQLALPPSEDRRAEMLALPPSRHDERRPNLNNDRLIQNERLALTNGPDRRPID